MANIYKAFSMGQCIDQDSLVTSDRNPSLVTQA